MKAVLMSIRQKWCAKIARGEKTVEVRKTQPKIGTPFKCYIYCTKSQKPGRIDELDKALGGGMVIGEFVCNRVESFTTDYRRNEEQTERISRQSCLCLGELMEYEGGSYCLYGWHISNLVIYDEPKELSEFHKCGVVPIDNLDEEFTLARAPQSWCYVEELQDGK